MSEDYSQVSRATFRRWPKHFLLNIRRATPLIASVTAVIAVGVYLLGRFVIAPAPDLMLLLIVGVAVIPLMLYYLRAPSDSLLSDEASKKLKEATELLLKSQAEIMALREALVLNRTSTDQAVDTALIDKLRETLTENVAEDIQKHFQSQFENQIFVDRIRTMFANDERRLFDQIANLRKRGNLNLSIGVATTLFAAAMLAMTVVYEKGNIADMKALVAYFVPRISTVIFIEVFSFFFLRLYKTTLAEEKYYQNEITSRSARQAALESALGLTDKISLAKLIELLAGINQNKFDVPKISEVKYNAEEIGKLVESAAKVIASVAQKGHGAD